MGLIDMINPLGDVPGEDPATRAMIDHLFKRYSALKLGEDIGGHIMPDHKRDLDIQNEELDLQLKRRDLGLPQNSDELESSENNRTGFMLGGLGHLSQMLPTPGLEDSTQMGAFTHASKTANLFEEHPTFLNKIVGALHEPSISGGESLARTLFRRRL